MGQEKIDNIQSTNLKIKNLVTSIFELSEETDLEHIKQNILPIDKKIEEDFKVIENVYLQKETELNKDKILLKLLVWFTVGEKMFAKSLYLNQKVNNEYSDLQEYQFIFASYNEELKHSITNIFNTFVKLVREGKNYKQFRYVYSFYQTFIINVLYLLPETYRNEVLNNPNFKDTKSIIEKFNYEIDFKDIDFKMFYKYMYEDMLIDFIGNNYDMDLHNMEPIKKGKIKSINNV